MFSTQVVKAIQQHPKIGAGNFLTVLNEIVPDTHQDLIKVEQPISEYCTQRHFTIADLLYLSELIAGKYCAMGVCAKETVGLYLNDDLSYFIHYLALNRIGAIPVCINDKLDPEIVIAFCRNAAVERLVYSDNKAQCFINLSLKTIKLFTVTQLLSLASTELPAMPEFAADDVILLAHTSGTTGVPKAVTFTHRSFFFGVQNQLLKQRGERVLCALPHSHSSAISVMMSSLLRGASTYILSDKSAQNLAKKVEQERSELIVAFPKTYVDLCRETLDERQFSSVGYWIATGDANHESHIRKLIALGKHYADGKRKSGSIFIDNLGSSEFGFAIFRNIHSLEQHQFDRCIGRAFEWVDAAVLNDKGEQLGPNQVGLLGVKSESVTAGYWNAPQLTEDAKLSGYWLTGDLVYFDETGKFFHVDRTTDPVYTKDGVLYSCLAEEVILKYLPEIFECSVFAKPDPQNPEFYLPHVCVELSRSASEIAADCLLDKVNTVLQQHDLIKVVSLTFQSGHEYTGVTGKKLKRQLRELKAA